MYPLYKDIRVALGPPQWIDKHGCPRYCEPTPENIREIYCDWACLMTVECQACQKTFTCGASMSWINYAALKGDIPFDLPDTKKIEHLIGWGDAPWHDNEHDECGFDSQCSGTTMCSGILDVTVWKRENDGWVEFTDFNKEDYIDVT